MRINNKFEIMEPVYIHSDPDQKPVLVVSIVVYGDGTLIYNVRVGTGVYGFHDFELSKDKNPKML